MHFIDEAGAEIFADRRDAAAEPDVAPVRRLKGAAQRRFNAVGDEMKGRAALLIAIGARG